MIIDDEPDILLTFSVILREQSFLVETFTDGTEAISSIKKNPDKYCLILIDLRMGRTTGSALARIIRDLNRTVSIVVVTASETESQDLVDVLNTHVVNGILRKPIDNTLLLELASRECCHIQHPQGVR